MQKRLLKILEHIWTMREQNDETIENFVKGIYVRCNFSEIAEGMSPEEVLDNLKRKIILR